MIKKQWASIKIESRIAAEKPHENEEIRRYFGGFRHLKDKMRIFQLYFIFPFKGGFCSALNEPAAFALLYRRDVLRELCRCVVLGVDVDLGPKRILKLENELC